jgi:hypothetical protein
MGFGHVLAGKPYQAFFSMSVGRPDLILLEEQLEAIWLLFLLLRPEHGINPRYIVHVAAT